MIISKNEIPFYDNNITIHKAKFSYEDKEWNALLNNGILNHRWLPSHHDPETDSDQLIPNLHGLNNNEDSILDPQAIADLDPVEEYLKCNENI